MEVASREREKGRERWKRDRGGERKSGKKSEK